MSEAPAASTYGAMVCCVVRRGGEAARGSKPQGSDGHLCCPRKWAVRSWRKRGAQAMSDFRSWERRDSSKACSSQVKKYQDESGGPIWQEAAVCPVDFVFADHKRQL